MLIITEKYKERVAYCFFLLVKMDRKFLVVTNVVILLGFALSPIWDIVKTYGGDKISFYGFSTFEWILWFTFVSNFLMNVASIIDANIHLIVLVWWAMTMNLWFFFVSVKQLPPHTNMWQSGDPFRLCVIFSTAMSCFCVLHIFYIPINKIKK